MSSINMIELLKGFVENNDEKEILDLLDQDMLPEDILKHLVTSKKERNEEN